MKMKSSGWAPVQPHKCQIPLTKKKLGHRHRLSHRGKTAQADNSGLLFQQQALEETSPADMLPPEQ